MGKKKGKKAELLPVASGADRLFGRVVAILEEARGNVVRSVNSNMVLAYWLIGREIVQEVQGGEERAEYGKQVLETLSARLQDKYKTGFAPQSLRNFRHFYLTYADRLSIRSPSGSELPAGEILSPSGSESGRPRKLHPSGSELPAREILSTSGRESSLVPIRHPSGGELATGFSPHLSWSHYRALMRVQDAEAREFYEREVVECGWTKEQLERQIQSAYYQRIVANRGKGGLAPRGRKRLPGEPILAETILKTPLVLEFLGLPDSPRLHESDLEQAIINNLQSFLLELGKGFSFVARQKQIRIDDDEFYIDLVFYNYILKCFVLIDLKIGKLTHADIGQMDGYVRLFEDRFKVTGDNPTIGLILCSDKSEAVAKYSVLNEGQQIFASKYLQFLPSEKALQLEIERERKQIERLLDEAREEEP